MLLKPMIFRNAVDAVCDAAYTLTLQPTIWDIKHEARKIAREEKKGNKAINGVFDKFKKKDTVDEEVVEETVVEPETTEVDETVEPEVDKTEVDEETKTTKSSEPKEKSSDKVESEDKKNDVIDLESIKKARNEKLKRKGLELIDLTTGFMVNNTKIEKELNDEEKCIVNGIASMFNYGKIFEDHDVVDLKRYDITLNPDAYKENYAFDINKIASMKNTAMMDKINHNIELRKHPDVIKPVFFNKPNIEDSVIHPVKFTKLANDYSFNQDMPVKGKGISNNLFKKLEKAFLPHLHETKHHYVAMDNGLIRLYYDNGCSPCGMLTIDPGLIMGGGKIYVMAKIPGDFVFVDTDHHSIIKKLLTNNLYELNPDEYQEVISKLFRNLNHYKFIDLHNTSFMSKLSEEDFQKLGKKLTFVMSNVSDERPGMILPRFRITNWKSVDDFDMISDNKVISPMAQDGETLGLPELGLKVQVRKDTMIEYKNDQKVSEYTVEQYANM